MKKLLFMIIAAGSLFSCNSDEPKDVPASENMPGVQNVNGNMPDTTNSINLDNKTDSATTDSTGK